ncbi:MAG: D-alanine--D-alanine ligase, partial [Myxococcales bacterium]|nr:D-alanine--D-alanine ligase [Myxococcales bacterium]
VEIEPMRTFYDYEAKYGTAGTRYHLPPRLDAADVARVEALGLAAHRALGCRGATRTDVMFGGGQPIVLEVNTLPGMTATSLVPKVAAATGIPFEELVERILDAAAFGPEGQR